MKTPKEEGILCAIGNLCSSLRIETTAQNWHRFREMSRRTARVSGAVHIVCPRLWQKVLGTFHKLGWPIKCVVQGLKHFWAISLYLFCNPDARYLFLSGWQKVWNKKIFTKFKDYQRNKEQW